MQLSICQIGHPIPVTTETYVPVRALLLEDSPFDQQRISRLAHTSGLTMQIDVASSLDQLKLLLDSQRYDVVLLDYVLPRGSGYDALAILRNHETNRNTPAVMIAGDDEMDPSAVTMRENCDGALCKDLLTAERLKTVIMLALNSRSAAASQPEQEAEDALTLGELEDLIRDIRGTRAAIDAQPTYAGPSLAELEQKAVVMWKRLKQRMSSNEQGHLGVTHEADSPYRPVN